MKVRIRLTLDANKPKTSLRGRNLKSIVKPDQVVMRRELLRDKFPAGWIFDRQTPAQLRARERKAQKEAEKSGPALLMKRLSSAQPTGERCKSKACPFPAVLDGECRKHVIDRAQSGSLLPSSLGADGRLTL